MIRWLLCPAVWLVVSCIGDTDVAPPAPTLLSVTSPTTVPRQTLGGGKVIGAAVLNHGEIIVEHDDSRTWTHDLLLVPGSNLVSLTAQSRGGKVSKRATEAEIFYEPPCPPPAGIDPVVSPINNPVQTLAGEKPPDTAVELWRLDAAGGVLTTVEVEPLGDATTWSHDLTLSGADGVYRFAIVARDGDDKVSEPELFVIELDTTSPVVVATHPLDGTTAVPINSTLEVAFDRPLAFSALGPPAMSATAGGPVAGTLFYHALSHTLAFTPATDLPADTLVTVNLVAAELPDAAGNLAASFAAWSFTTGAVTDATSPTMPEVTGGDASPTTAAVAALTGNKDAGTSIWINNTHVVAVDEGTTWNADWPLGAGSNDLVIVAKRAYGAASAASVKTVVRNLSQPSPPGVEPAPPASVTEPRVLLGGGKDADTAILINGAVAVCRTAEGAWGVDLPLHPGPNDIEIRARNAAGVVSEPVVVSVDFEQTYQGPVPGDFWLQLSLDLRDLSAMIGMFDEAPNMYSLDVWLEGPLEPGEVCAFDGSSFERQAIAPPLTLLHYKGNTATAENPFTMADYRAPDFIAALVASGNLPGVDPSADRRDANGRTALVLPSGVVDDVDETCYARGSLSIDGCTEATKGAGLHIFEWPLLAVDNQRIPQGEYLLNILINLDRKPSWVGATDTETCWADTGFARRGPHRIVRRMSLGNQAYAVQLTPLSDTSGPDSDPAALDGQLRYVGDVGGRIEWGPR